MSNCKSAWTDSNGNGERWNVLLLSIGVDQCMDLSESLFLTQVNQFIAFLLAK